MKVEPANQKNRTVLKRVRGGSGNGFLQTVKFTEKQGQFRRAVTKVRIEELDMHGNLRRVRATFTLREWEDLHF